MIKNYFSLTASQFISRIISFFWVAFMARTIGVADYGRYSTVLASIGIATSFLDLGVHYIIVRENVKRPELSAKFLGAQIYLRLIFGLISIGVFGFVMHWSEFSTDMKMLLFLAGLHMLFHNIGMIGDTVFSVYNKQYLTAIMHTIHNLGWAIFGYIALKSTVGLYPLFVAMALNSLIICVIYLWLVFSKFTKPDFHLNLPFVSHLLKAALPIGLTGVFYMLFQKLDRLFLSYFCGDYDVGLYSAAMALIGPIGDLAWSAAIIILYPYMAGLADNVEQFNKVFRVVLVWLFAIILGSVAVLIGFSEKIIVLIYGSKFLNSSHVLGILALQLLPLPFHGLFARVLMVKNKQQAYCFANFIALLSNLILNYFLISKWSILGAGVAAVITSSLLIFYYGIFSGLSISALIDARKILKISVASIILTVAARWLGHGNLWLSLLIFSVLYLPLAYHILNLRKEWSITVKLLTSPKTA